VRVIAATNRSLIDRARGDSFREDLYFRLAVVPVTTPPLRERVEDIPPLVEHFASSLARETGGKPKRFTADALRILSRYPFPGNVRELRNLVERLLIMTSSPSIGPEQVRAVLPHEEGAPESKDGVRLGDLVQEFERTQITAALEASRGNMTQAASRLGLERSHLYKKMRKLGWKTGP
jgi:two-component system nitrogen regulation response regulator NtrX